jgi:hypothetical protein
MKKDIIPPVVEDIALAIVKEQNELAEDVWNVYMLNLKKEPIEGVLVTSKGYGSINGEDVKTSTLRHFLDVIPAKGYARIEPIMEDLFGLSNEYWVSFYLDRVMYDKKYVFLAESIREDNFIPIPLIGKKGVMIR